MSESLKVRFFDHTTKSPGYINGERSVCLCIDIITKIFIRISGHLEMILTLETTVKE